jgi:Ca-activated chloride channel family protein
MTGFNEERASQKVIILLTDGEANESTEEVASMAQTAADEGVIIYAVGFGSPDGEPIPEYDELGNLSGYKKDRQGQTVLTQLDETTLQQVALTTSGRYFRASADGREVGFLANAIGDLQTGELESRFETRGIERFQWFLGLAILGLVIIELIPDRLRQKATKQEFAPGKPVNVEG